MCKLKMIKLILFTLVIMFSIQNHPGDAWSQGAKSGDIKVISGWRSEGKLYSMSKDMKFYSGIMKGTFFVKDKSGKGHYLHANRMTCPFSVQIENGKDILQGMCHLENQSGERVTAKIACTGLKENCQGDWIFVSGKGSMKGIKGKSKMKIRVDLVKKEFPESSNHLQFGSKMNASGYLIINELNDNVDGTGRIPKVK
jgi:hypothetical protein